MTTAKIVISPEEPIAIINPNIQGHFAEHLGGCIYDGIWVGEESTIPNIDGIRTDVVEALRRLRPPVVRWPGGCFADDYHWRDGIGPRAERPRRVNLWWGETIESNAFGTHEFLRFCNLIGAQPYICGNVGSGSPRELRDWVEYCNFPGESTLALERGANGSPEPFGVQYWGVGNENWGCGGSFCPEDYGAEYKRFATYLRGFGDTPLYLIACGPSGNNPDWTRRFFDKLGRFARINGFAAHYYCRTAGTATEYSTDQWYELLHRALRMEPLVVQQRAILDGYDPERKIGLIVDEWGTWHPPTPGRHPRHLWQQNTLRDALVAAMTLDIFQRHADKVVMANIAQTINVLQAMILTDGPRMLTTPTYHVYDMYQTHQGGQSLRTRFEADEIVFSLEGNAARLPGLSGSASIKDGILTLTVVNAHATSAIEADVALRQGAWSGGSVITLTDDDIHAYNTFEAPDALVPVEAPSEVHGAQFRHTFPPASVTAFRLRVA
ncbi:MAG TPA: alpha-N-arabinofuranosidase [Chloroflexi bacterium]|jgi:alpha-N-arabinofuranosidase|nr:alpha-N-arabinofuranosidase [Chloroflexota bacterium]